MGNQFLEHGMTYNITRRGFLKTTAATCAVMGAPVLFTGCKSKTIHYPADDCLLPFRTNPALSNKNVLEPAFFGPIKVKNRIVRSATSFHDIDEHGRPTGKLLDIYAELSQGGVGTIITGMTDGGLLLDDETFR